MFKSNNTHSLRVSSALYAFTHGFLGLYTVPSTVSQKGKVYPCWKHLLWSDLIRNGITQKSFNVFASGLTTKSPVIFLSVSRNKAKYASK